MLEKYLKEKDQEIVKAIQEALKNKDFGEIELDIKIKRPRKLNSIDLLKNCHSLNSSGEKVSMILIGHPLEIVVQEIGPYNYE